jgi:hypothetical protein
MSDFSRFLAANRDLRRQLTTGEPAGLAVIEAHQSHVFYLYSVLKIGAIFAHLQGLRPVLYPPIRCGRKQHRIVASLASDVVASRLLFALCALQKLPWILRTLATLRTRRDVVSLSVDGIPIGPYVFDAIYRPGMRAISLKQRIHLFYLLVCHWMDRRVIDCPEVKLVVIGDPGHRTGMLFALCRTRGIKCINAINPDIFQMHKYYTPGEFSRQFRDVPDDLIATLEKRSDIPERVDRYLAKRFQGAVVQHDVLRAYASHKLTRSHDELVADYSLDPALPIVFVMAHVFSDMPHTYAGMLYTDYEEWLQQTVLALARNQRISFLVKEHPTADLYAESGKVSQLLDAIGQSHRLLQSNVHTQTVLSNATAIVTCGGTIGIEASVRGIPAVLAARPPYSGKGFTREHDTIGDYEGYLASGIEHAAPLSDPQIRRAKNVAYAMFELFDNDGRSMETGGVPNIWGKPYNEEAFYRGVAAEAAVPVAEQRIYAAIKRFENSPDTSMINHHKLNMPPSTP